MSARVRWVGTSARVGSVRLWIESHVCGYWDCYASVGLRFGAKLGNVYGDETAAKRECTRRWRAFQRAVKEAG